MTPDVNLLPIRFRRWAAARHILSRWGLLGAVLVTVVGAVGIRISRELGELELQIALAQQQAAPLKSVARKSSRLRSEIDVLSSKWNLLSRLGADDDILQSIGTVGVACKDVDNKVRVKSIQVTLDAQSRIGMKKKNLPSKRKDSDSAKPKNQLVMHISAESDALASELIENLKSSPRIHTIELRSAGGVKGSTSRLLELEGDLRTSGALQ